MALTAYLTLQLGGQKVQGSSRFKTREGQILVIGMSHEIVSHGHERHQFRAKRGLVELDGLRRAPDAEVGNNVANTFGNRLNHW